MLLVFYKLLSVPQLLFVVCLQLAKHWCPKMHSETNEPLNKWTARKTKSQLFDLIHKLEEKKLLQLQLCIVYKAML